MAPITTKASFWKFNPRFYRGTRTNLVFPELYWVLSFEFLAMAILLAVILMFAIPESIRHKERLNKEVERMRQERLDAPVTQTSNSQVHSIQEKSTTSQGAAPGAAK